MRLNNRKVHPDDPTRAHFVKILESHTAEFFKEHDIDTSTFAAKAWPLNDIRGMKLYAEYLGRHRILNCKAFCLTTITRQVVVQGFDIEEDELYTLQSLKHIE